MQNLARFFNGSLHYSIAGNCVNIMGTVRADCGNIRRSNIAAGIPSIQARNNSSRSTHVSSICFSKLIKHHLFFAWYTQEIERGERH